MNRQINPEPSEYQTDQPIDLIRVWNRIRNWIKAPVFEDDREKTRKAALLNSILLVLGGSYLLMGAVFPFTDLNLLQAFIAIASLEIFVVTNLFLLRRGHVRGTATSFVIVLWSLLIVISLLLGTSYPNFIHAHFVVVIFLSGFLLSNRAAILSGILAGAYLFLLNYIIEVVAIPVVLDQSETLYFMLLVLLYTMMTFFVVITNQTTSQAFRQIEESDQKMRKANDELESVRTYLEQEVEANTRQLERRSRYLEAAARVANTTISLLNEQEMIQAVASEITKQFGFYHVGVFLLDEGKEWAALLAASSEGGQRMINRNHRLAVGRQGIVGFVTSMGQARISQDIGTDRVHTPAEELPNTRSEMALPLIARGEIIGAIDIQDTQPEAFAKDDITVLQAMADQIALGLENIRLYQQTQETLEEVRRVYGDYSERAWHEAQQKNLLSNYRYFGGAVTKLNQTDEKEVVENKVSIPVEVRGITLGAIEISKGEGDTNWSDDELRLLRALADQIGVALDSARLFNESQLRAATEHTISQINSQLWETMDINAILRTTAQNLRQTLELPELTIHMTAPGSETASVPSSNGSQEVEENEDGQTTD